MLGKICSVAFIALITWVTVANFYRLPRQISGQRTGLKCPEHFNCLLTLTLTKPQCRCLLGYQTANWTAYYDCFVKNNITERCPQQRPATMCFNFEDSACYSDFQDCQTKYYGYVSPLERRRLDRIYSNCNQKIGNGDETEDYKL